MDKKMFDDLQHATEVLIASPTYKRTRSNFEGVKLALRNENGPSGAPDIDSLCTGTVSAISACSNLASSDHQEQYPLEKAIVATKRAFRLLQEIERSCPEAAELAHETALMLMFSWASASTDLTNAQIAREIPAMRPIVRMRVAKAAAVERAKAIATEQWQTDTAQEIRVGEMADKVYRLLATEGFAESLPDLPERLKEWIKPVAPSYARKGGRRRKTH